MTPDLPEFTFKVIPDLQSPDAEGNPQSTIQDVQGFRDASNEPLQSLQGCEWVGMEPPYRASKWFRVEDMNFDGYADILTNWGLPGTNLDAFGYTSHRLGTLNSVRRLASLARFNLDPATKTITTHGND